MVLIAIAWTYVVLMMAVVEATSSSGTLLGAVITFVLYGVLPLGIALYLLATPARRRARRAAEAREAAASAAAGQDPDRGHHPAGAPVAAEREEA